MCAMRIKMAEPRHYELEEYELPATPGPEEVLIQAACSLISPGTELAIYTGKHSFFGVSNWLRFPMYPGYCMAGRVLAAGSAVTHVRAGDRIFATMPHATHAVVRASDVLKIEYDEVGWEAAAFAELGAIALNGVRMAEVTLGAHVLVAGQGIIGLLAARLAKLAGAMPLVVMDLNSARLALGREFGADAAVNTDEGLAEQADIVIEATGNPQVIPRALGYARTQGRVVLLGSPHGEVSVNFYEHLHARRLQVVGAHINSSRHAATPADPWTIVRNKQVFLDLVRRGLIHPERLITHRIRPAEADRVLKEIASGKAPDALGILIRWDEV